MGPIEKQLNSRDCAKVLKALAEGIRLEIIQCLFKIGKNHSKVSHHLGVLKNSGLVVDKKEGKFVIYQVHPVLYKQFKSARNRNALDFKCCSIEFRNRFLEKSRG